MSKLGYALLAFCWICLISCRDEIQLFKVASPTQTGIDFENQLSESDDLNILDYLYFYNGGGVAIGDINNDDLPDIFLSGNQVKNKLYLNKGNLQFEDISGNAGIQGNSSWNTGATMVDINGDGWLDIYVCAVVGIKGFAGHNELYINNSDGTFSEQAKKYNLDFQSYSSNAAYLDYDKDGDLDIYLLNHAIHTPKSFGKAEIREQRNYETGDKLLRNDGDSFTDVSEQANIYGGINGYGLGVAIADFNQDGWPDIYVGNDFHEDDYFYLNNRDGTFTERLKDYFGHISRFSMGNDVADLNQDGLPELISLDMLPEDEKILKSSEGDDNIQIQKLRTQRYGYHYQFTRNMLFVNRPNSTFAEVALMSGVEATDWSWSALFADYNQDGIQDLFISNGIPKRPNDLDYINFVSSEHVKTKIENTKLIDQRAIELMPSGKVGNYVFEGSKNLAFINRSNQWLLEEPTLSGATAIADLDNDGDIDIICNELNTPPTIYENQTNGNSNYLKIKLRQKGKNKYGIGTKVYVHYREELQYKELYTVRGFQASSEPIVHFGFGDLTKIDSLRIIWPDQTYQVIYDIDLNQTLTISPDKAKPYHLAKKPADHLYFEEIPDALGIDFTHIEDSYSDFNREKLIPYQLSDRGPAIAIGDINGDKKDDIYFGSSKFNSPHIFIANDASFIEESQDILQIDPVIEDTDAILIDISGDGKQDLCLAAGGGDFFGKSPALVNPIFYNTDTALVKAKAPQSHENTAILAPCDYDNDGDMDVFVGNQSITGQFGKTPPSYLLKNESGQLSIDENNLFPQLGMVTDAHWADIDGDGLKDLIVVGEWMSPMIFENTGSTLEKSSDVPKHLNGLWQSVHPYDIDEDGDMDFILGNWGLNSKFSASTDKPMRMYVHDFDGNGQTEPIVALYKKDAYYPLLGLNELASQMPMLRKKFNNYSDFAGKPVEVIFEKEILREAKTLEIHTLQSGYLRNDEGNFSFVPFDNMLQLAPIMAICVHDFDNDGNEEALVAGNYFGVTPFHGRLDGFDGALIHNADDILQGHDIGLNLSNQSVRDLSIITFNNQEYLIITINNAKAKVYKLGMVQ